MIIDKLKLPADVNKYLNKYSYDKWIIEWNETTGIYTAVVIPAIREYSHLMQLFESLAENDNSHFANTLVIFVINNSTTASEEIRQDNLCSIDFIRSLIKKNHSTDLSKKIISSGLQIGLIDASSPGLELPQKDAGVGLARKIGMDAALSVFDYSLTKKKLLVCLDADCTVSNNYITETNNAFRNNNISAASINFEHDISGDDETTRAIICYEVFLRYYVLGLKYACSPYAFHTVGSAMACDHELYMKIEGMNKKKAAEDFYFLEKLAKALLPSNGGKGSCTSGVYTINSTCVYPSGRPSWRVPFGTGQRVGRFLSHERNEYTLYDPECFTILKNWLNLFASNNSSEPEYYLEKAKDIHPELNNYLVQQKFSEAFTRITGNSKSNEQAAKQKTRWFDAFRTMKLLHHLRDTTSPEINMFDALDRFFSLAGLDQAKVIRTEPIPGMDVQKKYLLYLRQLEKEF